MNNHLPSYDTISGTAGGTLLVILLQVDASQVYSTIILASIGAMVSYLVSLFCKFLYGQIFKDIDHIDQ